jgi:zinc protease
LAAAASVCLVWAGPAAAIPARLNGAPISSDDPAYPLTRPNPDAEIGKLENGLTYGVMSRTGTRQVSLILYIEAGSNGETESERGVAHFLEHMAFNGSTHYPPGTVMQRFADIGVSIGRDQNAETGFDSTAFSLDLSEVTPSRLDTAFTWLRDVADGLTIDQDQVDRERGVIMSEYIGSRSPSGDLAEEADGFLLPGLLGPKRLPIGLKTVITQVNAETIRSFYHRWYRPQNAIVVAVGDLPRDELKARIEAAFGSWRNDTSAPPKVDPGHVDRSRATAALTQVDGHAAPTLQVCRLADKDAVLKEGVASRTRDFEQELWQSVLAQRLNELADAGAPPFVSAEVDRREVYDAAEATCVSAVLRDQDWKDALAAISQETRRLALHGLTDEEYQAGLKALNAEVETEVGQAPTMTASQLAQSIVSNLTLGGTFSTAEEDQRIGRLALAGFSRDKVDAEFARTWSDAAPPLAVLVAPTALAKADVLRAWRLAEAAAPPAAPPAHSGKAWAYAAPEASGAVATRQALPDIDAAQIAFKNGVRLNFKSSQNAQDRVDIRIRFGAGQQELAAGDLAAARLGASLLREGGLGHNSYDDTVRFCQGHACDFDLSVMRDAFVISGATRPSDLPVELLLIAAYLSDPGFRPELNARVRTAVRSLYDLTRSDPSVAAAVARDKALPPPQILGLPDAHTLDGVTSADFARILRPPLQHDGLEVTIVGDLDEATAVEAVAKTLGALPPRRWGDEARPDAPKVRYPASEPTIVRVAHDGSPEKATVLATWPLFVWSPDKVREQRIIDLLSDIVQAEAIDDIRQRLGKAYSPQVEVQLSRGGDQGSLTVAIDTAPTATDVVAGELRKIAQKLAAGDITPQMLERVRRPVLDDGATREISNPWWIDMLDGSWAHPDQLAAAKTWQSDYEGITLEEVQAEARRWLAAEPLVVIAAPVAKPSKVTSAAPGVHG